ncbi:cytochrome P450 [Streptomyces alkaliterrae]|uniref:Cytochrome P450 n=1 Tax=Streptomyces alkaliterrae TaxID=2213162 RepID=A0A5P0YTD4_9ACTN|nr:cytochrome P450 [Streptomyces alkaliterrae]MBB1262320.1 cytochrome P450 [Streptomyces alkaliterrae]MQS02692.1 cytochrome P450 [Streptomyces alkaliterrae]
MTITATTACPASAASADLPAFPFDWNGLRLPAEIEELRAEPVRKVRTIAGSEAWLVSSYPLCKRVLEDPVFSLKDTSAPGAPRQYALTIPPEVVNNMGNITGAGLRRAVLKALNPKAPGLVEWMSGQAGRLLDALVAEGAPADLRADFADPYSADMHCHILGIPEADGARLMRSLPIAFMNSPHPIEAAKLNWDRDIAYMVERLDDPATTGLMADLAALRGDPEYAHLTDEMLATVGVTLFGAGVISTAGFLTMAIVSVLTRPDVRQALERDGVTPGALDEILRVNLSIADGLPRLATEDVQLGDTLIRKGELVLVLVEAANHDPDQFPDPMDFDPARDNAHTHLSFGGGQHYCPATALGRKHAEIALGVLLERLPTVRLAVPTEQLVWRTNFMKRLPERLPAAW